jgi:putative ABC transport system permease protein
VTPRLGRLARSAGGAIRKPTVEDEVSSELDFHIEMRTRELIAAGMDPAKARAEAVARFGDLGQVQHTLRRIGYRRDRRERRTEWLAEARQDVVYALRQLRRTPTFALLAIVTLGIGIGATTSIFSAVYTVLLRALPYPDPGRIVNVFPVLDGNDETSSAARFFNWRRDTRSFEHLAAVSSTNVTLVERDRPPERLGGAQVSSAFFRVLGVPPMLGRVFTDDEEIPGHDQVAVLSHALWVNRFAADSNVIGRVVQINSRPVTIVGVMPASFTLSSASEDLWIPLALDATQQAEDEKGFLNVFARLRRGVTIAQATDDVKGSIRREVERAKRANTRRTARIAPLYDSVVGDLRDRMFILLGAVGLVLLIACGNVANLLLARGAARAREIAVRAAIGAGRGRIIRQLLTESVVLAMLGGAVGIGLAAWGMKLIVAMSPEQLPRLHEMRLEWVTVAFAFALAAVSAIIFGMVPALRLASTDLHATMKEGGRTLAMGGTRDRLRRALVVAEVALSLVLLIGAGLLIRSGIQLQKVNPGFDPERLFTGAMTLPVTDYPTPQAAVATFLRIRDAVRGAVGVESSALVFSVPLSGANAQAGVTPEGKSQEPANQVGVGLHLATPGIFTTMRIPMRSGRDFTDQDVMGSPRVTIVNEQAAKTLWPDQNPIGKRFGLLRDSADAPLFWEVVGVVGDVRERGLQQPPRPEMYLSFAQAPPIVLDALQRTMYVVARTRGQPLAATKAIQRAVAQVDPTLPLFAVNSMEERLSDARAGARFNTILLTVMGAIGLALAAIGIFGVISYFVSQRAQEIGVRMALGATPRRVLMLVVGQGIRPVVLGVILGVLGAVAASRLLRALLFGVSPADPLTLAGMALGVTLIAVVAALFPARRATRIDPLVALREY